MLECWELKESSQSLGNNTGYNVLEQEWNVQEAKNLNNTEGTVKNCGSVTKFFVNYITFSKIDFNICIIIRSGQSIMVLLKLQHIGLLSCDVINNDLEEDAWKYQEGKQCDAHSVNPCVEWLFEDNKLPHWLRNIGYISLLVESEIALNILDL